MHVCIHIVDEQYLDYVKFLDDLQLKLDGPRLEVVSLLYSALNPHNGSILKQTLISNFNAENHPLVTTGQYSYGQIEEMFSNAFKDSEGV